MKPMTLVRFTSDYREFLKNFLETKYVSNEQFSRSYYENILNEKFFVYLGEISNMSDHGVFVGGTNGLVYSGWHLEDFEEMPEDEM